MAERKLSACLQPTLVFLPSLPGAGMCDPSRSQDKENRDSSVSGEQDKEPNRTFINLCKRKLPCSNRGATVKRETTASSC